MDIFVGGHTPLRTTYACLIEGNGLQKRGFAQRLSADLIEQGGGVELGNLLVQSQAKRGQRGNGRRSPEASESLRTLGFAKDELPDGDTGVPSTKSRIYSI